MKRNRKLILVRDGRVTTEEQEAREQRLMTEYNGRPELKTLADEIHARRLLPPPTCLQCIEIAISQLGD